MLPYFQMTKRDKEFYGKYLKGRLPNKIFDIHVHLNTEEHIRSVPASRWKSDWALEAGHLLPIEDAFLCAKELYPDTEYKIAGFPWPIREADLKANNSYLADNKARFHLSPFMCVMPAWDSEEIEGSLIEGGFIGFKPYPDMVSGVKGAEISIFDFLPPEQWRILDKHGKAVMLHLPRKDLVCQYPLRKRYADTILAWKKRVDRIFVPQPDK